MFDEVDFYVINNLIKGTPSEVIARGLTDGEIALRNRIRKYEELGLYFRPGVSSKISKTDLQIFNCLLSNMHVDQIANQLGASIESVKSVRAKFYRIKMQSAIQSDYKMSDEEKEILDLYRNGLDASKIARKLNLSLKFVLTTIKRLEEMKVCSPKGKDLLDRIIQYREEGLTEKQIAEKVGLTPNQIWSLISKMRKQGIDVPKRKKGVSISADSKDLDKKIAALLVHHSQSDIARKLGLSRQAVSVRVKKIKSSGIDGESVLRDSVISYIQNHKPTLEQFDNIVKEIKELYLIDVSDLSYLIRQNHDYETIER